MGMYIAIVINTPFKGYPIGPLSCLLGLWTAGLRPQDAPRSIEVHHVY